MRYACIVNVWGYTVIFSKSFISSSDRLLFRPSSVCLISSAPFRLVFVTVDKCDSAGLGCPTPFLRFLLSGELSSEQELSCISLALYNSLSVSVAASSSLALTSSSSSLEPLESLESTSQHCLETSQDNQERRFFFNFRFANTASA